MGFCQNFVLEKNEDKGSMNEEKCTVWISSKWISSGFVFFFNALQTCGFQCKSSKRQKDGIFPKWHTFTGQQRFDTSRRWELNLFTPQRFKPCLSYFFFPSPALLEVGSRRLKFRQCMCHRSLFHKVFLICLQASAPKPSLKQAEAAPIMFNQGPNRYKCSLAYKTLSRCCFPGIQLQTMTLSGEGPAQGKYLPKGHYTFHPVALPMAQRFSQIIFV